MKLRLKTQDQMITAINAAQLYFQGENPDLAGVKHLLQEAYASLQADAAQIPAHPMMDGKTFDPALDFKRLEGLLGRVFQVMTDGKWHTLAGLKAFEGPAFDIYLSDKGRAVPAADAKYIFPNSPASA